MTAQRERHCQAVTKNTAQSIERPAEKGWMQPNHGGDSSRSTKAIISPKGGVGGRGQIVRMPFAALGGGTTRHSWSYWILRVTVVGGRNRHTGKKRVIRESYESNGLKRA